MLQKSWIWLAGAGYMITVLDDPTKEFLFVGAKGEDTVRPWVSTMVLGSTIGARSSPAIHQKFIRL
jgi:hypothetical protein